jgi:hypothetical protein
MVPTRTAYFGADPAVMEHMGKGAENGSRRLTLGQRKARSAVSNGVDLLPGIVDARCTLARRFRDIVSAIVVDQGGEDRCSESRKQLIRRFAAAAVLAEQMESKLVNGEEINISEHAQLCSSLVRICQRIGINRRLKNITPALPDYLEDTAAKVAGESNESIAEAVP